MTVEILKADARSIPLPDRSVDLVVTSPPYWQAREYQDGGVAVAGQIGQEPTARDELVTLLIDYLDAREWYDGTGSTERFVEAIHLAEVLLAAGWTKGDA